MNVKDPPDRDILQHADDQVKGTPWLLSVAFLLVLVVCMFLLGCFVIGPILSGMSHSETTVVDNTHIAKDDLLNSPEPSIEMQESPTPAINNKQRSEEPANIPAVTLPQSQDAALSAKSRNPFSSNTSSSDNISSDIQKNTTSNNSFFRVRAGTFSERTNADALAAKLVQKGYAPAVYQVNVDGQALYSVQLGAFKSKENAEELVNALKQSGFDVTVAKDN